MPTISAGMLMYRIRAGSPEVFLVHPGGPWWRNKDAGAWTIPKGQIEGGEEPLGAARREFLEETGLQPAEPFHELGGVRQKAGKLVYAWAFEGDCDPAACTSNTFEMEWPVRSGKWVSFPEIDRAEFFSPEEARKKINPAQRVFLDRLTAMVAGDAAAHQ